MYEMVLEIVAFTSCLRFLTHSGNENLYQSYLYQGGANMNHQTIYCGKCHYHGFSIQESSSQNSRIIKIFASLWPWLELFQFSVASTSRGSIPMHQSRSNITGPSTSGFSSKTDELTLRNSPMLLVPKLKRLMPLPMDHLHHAQLPNLCCAKAHPQLHDKSATAKLKWHKDCKLSRSALPTSATGQIPHKSKLT